MDQARTLRRLAEVANRQPPQAELSPPETTLERPPARVLSFSSGKGGVGKTHVVVNLAYALRRRGARVMILDADLGLANVDVLLGLVPRFNIQHVLAGEKTLADVVLEGPAGIRILPASSGAHDLVHLTEGQRLQLLAELDTLEEEVDFLLIDTGAGISANVMYFNVAAHQVVVVVTPEPTSITDAYALMKILATKYHEKNFTVVMNAVANPREAKDAFQRLSTVTERFLNVSIDYLGFVLYDEGFPRAVRQQKPLLELYPNSVAARCFHQLAQAMLQNVELTHAKGNIQFFWKQLLTQYPQQSLDMPDL